MLRSQIISTLFEIASRRGLSLTALLYPTDFSKNLLEALLEERVEMGGGARTETAGLAASFHAVSRIFPARFSDGNEISVPFLYGRHLYG